MMKVVNILSQNIESYLFPSEREILPNIDAVYELQLAFYENLLLDDAELLRNAAYFAKVRNMHTRHFLMCTGESLWLPAHSSLRLRSFFAKNLFRTGYATHGLFPYRGKFHPQMIKGLMNIMGLKPGETVLDPMMGSGTVPLEAMLMGINSIGLDASPFCRFMTQTKIDALTMSLMRTKKALSKYAEVFAYFQTQGGTFLNKSNTRRERNPMGSARAMEGAAEYISATNGHAFSKSERETRDTYNLLLLAYLDGVGYSQRSRRRSPVDQFGGVLERYIFVVDKIQHVLGHVELDFGKAEILEGDARALPLADSSVDGVLFSPPYSFAIDYLKNDSSHLSFLGADVNRLREKMVGLRGRGLAEKFTFYKQDMDAVLAECSRVLRKERMCTIVIGTNNNQIGKALGVSPKDVPGLHEMLVEQAERHRLRLVKMLSRPIVGISNTLKREYMVMLQRQ